MTESINVFMITSSNEKLYYPISSRWCVSMFYPLFKPGGIALEALKSRMHLSAAEESYCNCPKCAPLLDISNRIMRLQWDERKGDGSPRGVPSHSITDFGKSLMGYEKLLVWEEYRVTHEDINDLWRYTVLVEDEINVANINHPLNPYYNRFPSYYENIEELVSTSHGVIVINVPKRAIYIRADGITREKLAYYDTLPILPSMIGYINDYVAVACGGLVMDVISHQDLTDSYSGEADIDKSLLLPSTDHLKRFIDAVYYKNLYYPSIIPGYPISDETMLKLGMIDTILEEAIQSVTYLCKEGEVKVEASDFENYSDFIAFLYRAYTRYVINIGFRKANFDMFYLGDGGMVSLLEIIFPEIRERF